MPIKKKKKLIKLMSANLLVWPFNIKLPISGWSTQSVFNERHASSVIKPNPLSVLEIVIT